MGHEKVTHGPLCSIYYMYALFFTIFTGVQCRGSGAAALPHFLLNGLVLYLIYIYIRRNFPYSFILARSACLRYAGCEHFVSALGPSALGWGKVSRILQIYAFVSFYTETTYQLITIGPRFYKNVIIFLFSHKRQQKLIIYC